jgi:hypothetical protein
VISSCPNVWSLMMLSSFKWVPAIIPLNLKILL